MGATLTGAQKLLGKIKIFIYSFFNLYFAPHAFINCKAASTPRPHLKHYVGRVDSGDSEGGPGWAMPPQIFACPPFVPPDFLLILRSFGWHMQGCQMRFVKIPAILWTAPDLSCVVIPKQLRERRETISIVKPQLIICPYFGWFVTFRCACDVSIEPTIAPTAANKLRWRICPDKIHY